MCSVDDENEVIALEAMNGLSKIFELIDESRVAPILVMICHRIRPAFEKPTASIRSASFNLFGCLWRFGDGPAAPQFYEQIHNNLPALLLHLQDESPQVQSPCRSALRRLAPLLRSKQLEEIFLGPALEEGNVLNYDAFLDTVSKHLID